MKIGEKIKELRKKQGITQEQLAENLGISFQAVSKWENEIALPDITLVPVIADFFRVTTDCLFDYTIPNSAIEIKVITPEKYEDVNEIIELLRKKKTAVVNCSNIDKETVQQIKDKVVSDVIGAHINHIENTLICMPAEHTAVNTFT